MAERPILFSAPMVRALLAGTKTQTRRVVKDQSIGDRFCEMRPDGAYLEWQGNPCCGSGVWEVPEYSGLAKVPYGVPGDRLWVKEKTLKVEDHGWVGPVYAESDAGRFALDWGYGEPDDRDHIPPHEIKFRPSIFMSRAMSRITLEVTDVRVERLQDISVNDAIAEGIPRGGPENPDGIEQREYRALWERLNGPGSWDANPWVWCVSFRRLEAA